MNERSDRFLGSWQVQETVFSAAGELLGKVQQKRDLHQLADGGILVSQNCQPEAALASTAMRDFVGDFEFVLQRKGCRRFYQGPDVFGGATEFCPGFLWGEGVWPGFGRNFRSWSIMVSAERQLTGGTFYSGEEVVAVVIGVASPDLRPAHTLKPWQPKSGDGDAFLTGDFGESVEKVDCRRTLDETSGWVDVFGGEQHQWQLSSHQGGLQMVRNGRDLGMARRYGPLLHWQIFHQKGGSVQGLEVLCPWGEGQYSIRQESRLGRVERLVGARYS